MEVAMGMSERRRMPATASGSGLAQTPAGRPAVILILLGEPGSAGIMPVPWPGEQNGYATE